MSMLETSTISLHCRISQPLVAICIDACFRLIACPCCRGYLYGVCTARSCTRICVCDFELQALKTILVAFELAFAALIATSSLILLVVVL